jgi:predicted dehydrogenase
VVEARALVIGAGSIGLRHRRVLEGLGVRTGLVSRRPSAGDGEGATTHTDLGVALRDVRPDHVVVATETATHRAALRQLAQEGFDGTVLVEKPLMGSAPAVHLGGVAFEEAPFRAAAVGYQLRFDPAVGAARLALAGAPLVSVEASVGQHLSTWRPGRDMGDTASARIDDGGGVLRDLSHELDLVLWLAGDWRRVCALGGRSGALGPTVETDDRWGILLELESGAVATIHLDAIDRVGRRRLTLVGAAHSAAVDLIAGTVVHAGPDGDSVARHPKERDEVLADMHRALLEGGVDERLCSLEQGMAVVRLIVAIERSVRVGGWVERGSTR